MPEESIWFRCPCCGQHAPIERVTQDGPFEEGLFEKTLGGKKKLTPADREARKGRSFHRGSAPGQLDYNEIPMTDEIHEAIARRIAEL